jgi:predicted amidohydrolase
MAALRARRVRPVTLRVACAQLAARPWEDASAALRDIRSALRAAHAAEARLVVFPEGSYPAYVVPEGGARRTTPSVREAVAVIARCARRYRMTVVIGVVQNRSGALYNEALVIEPDGSLAGSYAKACLWSQDHRWFRAGRSPRIIPTSCGPIGIMICADGRYPEIARSLVAGGARLICDPTAWVGWGPSYDRIPNLQADCMLRVRAAENGIWIAAADKCGSEREAVVYAGRSQIVSPEGCLAALAPPDRAAVITADVTLAPARPCVVALSGEQRNVLSNTRKRRAHSVHGSRYPPVFRLGVYQGMRTRGRAAFAALHAQGADAILATGDSPAQIRRTVRRLRGLRWRVLQGGDMLAPEPARAAALAGVDLILWLRPPRTAWALDVARTRAAENRVYVILCMPPSATVATCIIAPDGTIASSTLLGAAGGCLSRIDTRWSREKTIAFATQAFVPESLQGICWLDRRRGVFRV